MKIINGVYADRILRNKHVLNGLEKISEHGTSFVALTSFAMATTFRPLAISLTPDTEKRNKQYAIANSIGSGLIKLALVEAAALPVEHAIKNIDKNPDKFLGANTIKRLSNSISLSGSRPYKFITQMMKLSAGLFMAVPKSFLTVGILPFFVPNKKNDSNSKGREISFTGKFRNNISKGLGKIIDNKRIQDFAIKYQENDKNLAKHMSAATDTLLTASAAYGISKSGKIEENRKKFLIYNNIISTAITVLGGYTLDGFVKNKSKNFIEKFEKLHKGNPKLPKYIEGINILRPTLIFAGIYYGILPIFSTYISEKINKFVTKINITTK